VPCCVTEADRWYRFLCLRNRYPEPDGHLVAEGLAAPLGRCGLARDGTMYQWPASR